MHRSETPSLPLLLAAALLLVNQAPGARNAGLLKLSEPTPLASEAYAVAPNCVPVWIGDASGIRRLPDRCGGTTPAAATVSASAAASATASAALAQPPTSLASKNKARSSPTVRGRASATGAAAKGRASQDCSNPYWFDARGVRRLRPSCL